MNTNWCSKNGVKREGESCTLNNNCIFPLCTVPKDVKEFNLKYKDYIKDNHYGLAIYNTEFIKWLDEKFQEFIKIPGFKYLQIKAKFGYGRFYCEGLSPEQIREVEERITKMNDKTSL